MKRSMLWTAVLAIGTLLSTVMFIDIDGGQITAQTEASQIHVKDKTSMTVCGDEDDNTPREDKAEISINAPDKVKVGDMIVLDLSESLGAGFDYAVEPTPPGLRTFDNGQVIVCGTGDENVTYTFMISCALGGDSDIGIHKVKVTGAQIPGPPPDPGQNIVEKVKDWASDVDSPTKRDDAIKLAQSFASVAIIIEQNTFNTPAELVQATATSNKDALGDNLENWTPFLNSLMQELKAMAQLGKLGNMAEHARLWKEIAQALREYAQTL